MSRFHINRQHGKSNMWIVFILAPVLVLFAIAFSGAYWYQSNLQPLNNKENTEQVIYVPEGATVDEIGDLLEEKEVIKSSFAFGLYIRFNGYRDSMQAGGYKLSPSSSVQEIVARLIDGDIATDLVLIPPARRIDQVKDDFIKSGFDPAQVEAAFKTENYSSHPVYEHIPKGVTLEGYIYPDSYQKSAQTTPQEIITAALDELNEVLTSDLQNKFAQQGLTVYEAITLASIIENEVSEASGDRPVVAQVYLKRLAEGMLLQADPTAQYGAFIASGSTEDWINYDTPYNTYLHIGLPYGPISNVSRSSLEAVANPAQTDYLYFVADDNDDNTTHFSRTLAEHEQNIARYCQVKCGSY